MKKLKEILQRRKLYCQYKIQLVNIIARVVSVEGLPSTISVDEMMKNLIRHGFCVIANPYQKGNKLPLSVLDNATIGGVTEYDDIPQYSIYANPVNDSHTYWYRDFEHPQDCVIMKLSQNYIRFNSIIDKYALLLADCDITSDMILVSLRANNVLIGSASDSIQKKSIEKFFENLINGITSHIVSNNFIDDVHGIDLKGNKDDIIGVTTVKSNILRQFLRDIGVGLGKDKSQAILSDELESDIQYLRLNQGNIISYLQKCFDELSEVFGLDKITVSINEDYRIIESEGGNRESKFYQNEKNNDETKTE